MNNYLQLIRYKHYVKNFFIFLPLFFSGQITNIALLQKTTIAFIVFCIFASVIYIINDILDVKYDKQHPTKRLRPLASGRISIKSAAILLVVMAIIGITLVYFLTPKITLILLLYITLNIAYSYYLKHIAIIDISVIAIGFILRLFVGAVVDEIALSNWIVIMTFLLALFLAFAKRRGDVLLLLNNNVKTRKAIDGYNLKLIDNAMMIMASVVIVSYLLYTTSEEVVARIQSEYLYLTTIFVFLGILRYLQISLVYNNSASPTKIILKDKFTQLVILAWVLSFVWFIYL